MVSVQDGFLISLPSRKIKHPVMRQPRNFLLEYKLEIKELEDEVHPSDGDIGKCQGKNCKNLTGSPNDKAEIS